MMSDWDNPVFWVLTGFCTLGLWTGTEAEFAAKFEAEFVAKFEAEFEAEFVLKLEEEERAD